MPSVPGPLGEVAAWPLSAKTDAALRAQARQLSQHLEDTDSPDAARVARALAARTSFERRAVVVGADLAHLQAGLGVLARGETSAEVLESAGLPSVDKRVVFLFPGQGSQWAGMATGLLEQSPVFAEHLRACDAALGEHVDWSLEDVLRGEPGAPGLDRLDVVQPALFAVMVALARLWQACGVQPAAVLGHSQGEIAAAHIAGGLSLPDAARIVALRSQILLELAGGGRMASIALSEREAAERIERWGGRIEIAALNGPCSTVLTGELDAMLELIESCRAEDIVAREIGDAVGAGHSCQMETIRERFLENLETIAPRTGEIPFHSTVDAAVLDTATLDNEYWFRNVRQTVRYAPAIRQLLDGGHRNFIEISAHPVLTMPTNEAIEQYAAADPAAVIATLRRGEGDARRFMISVSELWTHGAPVDWDAIAPRVSPHAPLPTYPFQGERYWESGHTRGVGERSSGARRDSQQHPLLGTMVRLARGGSVFDGRIERDRVPWMADHAILGAPLLPPAALLEIALSAARRAGCDAVCELTVEAPLRLDGPGSDLQVTVADPDATGAMTIDIHSRPHAADGGERPWTRHATGTIATAPYAAPAEPSPRAGDVAWPPAGAREIDLDGVYERLAQSGEECGPQMQSLRAAWREEGIVFADVALANPGREAEPFALHPALLAGMLHAAALNDADVAPASHDGASADEAESSPETIPWPVRWRGVTVPKAGATQLRVRIARDAAGSVSILATDEAGEMVASVEALEIRPWPAGEIVDVARALLALEWRPPVYTSEERAADVSVVELGGAVCVDVDEHEASRIAVEHEVRRAAAAGETLLALRGGRASVPRLIHVGDVRDETKASGVLATLDPRRTVLIHAESALEAARLAAQLVSHDGAERMVLATPIDQRMLRDAELAGALPPLLRDLVRRPTRTAPQSAGRSLLRRLQRVAATERAPLVLEAVREAIADILRYDAAHTIDPHRALRDLGFDSVSALELRDRLAAMSGLAIPLSAVIDHPTPQALAEHLNVQLAESGQAGGERLAVHAEASAADRVVELATGGNAPILLCVPSVLAMSGPHEYVGLARAVEGVHDVCALHLPGFQPHSQLPKTMEEVLAEIARTTIEHTADSPFVLLGHSSGGLIAHALAARLQTLDHASHGVVLIDSYSTRGTSPATLSRAVAEILGASEASLSASEERLAAMGAYLELLRSWREEPVDAPVLLVRASEPMRGLNVSQDWRASWPLQHTAVDVAGDHLSMMGTHLAGTVAAIREWLSQTTRTRGAELEHAVD